MASPTYKARGIVLRKTRLGESDLIVEVMDESGKKLKLVAKGARKPASRMSAHLELFNVCDLLCVKGKSLDIVKESRLVSSRTALMCDPSKNAACGTIAELLCSITQISLEQPRLFDMTSSAFDAIDGCEPSSIPLLLAADILKTVSSSGFRPVLQECVVCGQSMMDGSEIEGDISKMRASDRDIRFSYSEGGCVCARCASESECVWLAKSSVVLAHRLLYARFNDILCMRVEDDTVFELLQMLQMWVVMHVGVKLKSLGFFMDIHYMRN